MKQRSIKIGDTFNYLTIIGFTEKTFYGQNRKKAICKCKCGNITEVIPAKLKSGKTKSCGCYRKRKFDQTTHGMSDTPIYKVWGGMKRRCNPNNKEKRTEIYRKKGIQVCEEWSNDFLVFHKWATENGYEKGLHLDRIDTNGDYCPENCQFISASENTAKVRKDRRTKLELLNRIEYLEKLLTKNNIKYDC